MSAPANIAFLVPSLLASINIGLLLRSYPSNHGFQRPITMTTTLTTTTTNSEFCSNFAFVAGSRTAFDDPFWNAKKSMFWYDLVGMGLCVPKQPLMTCVDTPIKASNIIFLCSSRSIFLLFRNRLLISVLKHQKNLFKKENQFKTRFPRSIFGRFRNSL